MEDLRAVKEDCTAMSCKKENFMKQRKTQNFSLNLKFRKIKIRFQQRNAGETEIERLKRADQFYGIDDSTLGWVPYC